MANINVQIKKRTGGIWDKIFPITVATNVMTGQGTSIEQVIKSIANDVKSFGAKGDGVANDTVALKAFLASGGNLVISDGTYMVDGGYYELVSNTHLSFSGKAKIKLRPHALQGYSMLQLKDLDNVTIKNAWLDGSKSQNTIADSAGEWGHGIDILNSTNVNVERPVVKNTWGDGIYIGHNFWGESTKLTEDVVVVDALIDNSRRNGISVCSGRNIKIIRPHIKNIRGVNPMAGIDIEPEGKGGAKPFLENLVISEPVIENCVSGVELLLEELKDRGLSVSIKVISPTIKNCDVPLTISKCGGVVGGTVVYTDVQVEKAQLGVIRCSSYKADNTPRVLIDGLVVDGFNLKKSADDFYNHCLIFLGLPNDVVGYDIGNVVVNNLNVKDNTNTTFKFLFADQQGTTFGVKKVAIINPYLDTAKERTNFNRKKNDIKIVDGLHTLRNFGTYYQQSIDGSLMTQFDSTGSTDTITLTSNDANVPVGHTVRFQVGSTSRVWFKPTTHVQGFSSVNGKGVWSENKGAYLEVIFKGDYWAIIGVYGTWTADP